MRVIVDCDQYKQTPMARRFAVDQILETMPREDYLAFEELCMVPGLPCFRKLHEWLAERGYRTTEEAVSRWYHANRDRYSTISPKLALWRTLTLADGRRDRLNQFLGDNWEALEQSLVSAIATGSGALKVLELMATVDLGVRVAAAQLHNLEVRIEQKEIVEATIAQVFRYIDLELQTQGLESLRREGLEALEGAIATRIASENRF
jgi:hypothetical protein